MRSFGEREILAARQSTQADARSYRLTAPMEVFFEFRSPNPATPPTTPRFASKPRRRRSFK